MAETLAKQVIEFAATGLEAVKQGIEGLRAGMERANAAITASPIAIGAAVAAMNALVASTRSWVNAGIAGTLYGNQLQLQFTLLSREIAGVFVPTIRKVIDGLREVTQWFRQLTGDQQANIRHWVEAAAVAALVFKGIGLVKGMVVSMAASLLGVLAPAFTALTGIVTSGALTMATAMNLLTAGITAIIGLVVSAATAAATLGAGIAVGTASGRSALQSLVAQFRPLLQVLGEVYDAVAAALGPVLEAVGATIGATITEAVAAVRQFIADIGGIGNAFKIALATMAAAAIAFAAVTAPAWIPLVLIVASLTGALIGLTAIVALLAAPFIALGALVALVIYGLWDNLQKLFTPMLNIGRALWASLVAVGRAVMAVVSAIGSALLSVFTSMGSSMDGIFDKLAEFAQWLADTIPSAVETMVHAIADLLDTLQGFAGVIDTVLGTNLQERLGALARQLRDIHVQVGNATAGATGQPRNSVTPAGGQFEEAQALFKRMTEASLKTAAEARRDQVQQQIATNTAQIAANTQPQVPHPLVNPAPGAGLVGAQNGIPPGLVGGGGF